MTGRGLVGLCLLVTLVVSLFYVRSRFLVVELSYEVAQKQQKKTDLEQERRSLILELATLRNPKRVERIASQSFGLERPTGMESIVIVPKGGHDSP
ncbi:MAG: cell division protein FtsL [Pseudomonadota bacterium]